MRSGASFKWVALMLLSLSLAPGFATAADRVLVYTRNETGKGKYIHENLSSSVAAIRKLGLENGFEVDATENPGSFTPENLKRYKALIFSNTNNEIFETEDQKAALQSYIRAGGGFVGIHSATGSMRNWPWFWSLIGGKFVRHPKLQTFTVRVKDSKDISTSHLPPDFKWTDEFYYTEKMPEGLHILLAGDLTTLDDPKKGEPPADKFGNEFPLAWRHEFEGGRAWYTALGHKKEHYSDPKLAAHILGGIFWAMGKPKPGA